MILHYYAQGKDKLFPLDRMVRSSIVGWHISWFFAFLFLLLYDGTVVLFSPLIFMLSFWCHI